jgi:hypothetical protein
MYVHLRMEKYLQAVYQRRVSLFDGSNLQQYVAGSTEKAFPYRHYLVYLFHPTHPRQPTFLLLLGAFEMNVYRC